MFFNVLASDPFSFDCPSYFMLMMQTLLPGYYFEAVI
jgi:hypothetical protein